MSRPSLTLFAVQGGSMRPALCPGDLVVATLGRGEPRPGQVVVLQTPVGVVVHRVIDRACDASGGVYYRTAGDANRREDIFVVPSEAVVGIARARLPLLGYPSLWALRWRTALGSLIRRERARGARAHCIDS